MRKLRFGGLAISLVLLAVGTTIAPAAAAGGASSGPDAALWVARYDGPATTPIDRANAVAASPDGTRVFVTGYSPVYAHGNDFATFAYDAVTGTQLWLTRYDQTSDDEAVAIAVSPDGTKVSVTGFQNDSVSTDFNYDAVTGTQLWLTRYDQTSDDEAVAIAVSPDG